MKKLLLAFSVTSLLVGSAIASQKDTTINIYGVGAKTDKDESSHSGAGIMYDSEDIKVKLEGTSDFFKSGVVLKFNPYTKTYIKAGANYIHQKMYAPDHKSAWVNQYSGGLAFGYMAMDTLYLELGGSYTKLNGTDIGDSYTIADEKTKRGYIEAAKRWETSIGTIDTTANYGRVNPEHSKSVSSYGGGIDYYPTNYSKISFMHQQEKNNNANVYGGQYGMFFAEYADNTSNDTYQATIGLKVAFDDLFDVSTWKAPTNIKPHLSELHKFESMTFATNMNIQSSNGIETKQVEQTNTPNNTAPTASAQSLDAGGGETVTHNLNANIADAEDADNALTIVVASAPSHGGLTWNGNEFTYEVTDGSFYAGNDSFTYYVRDTQGATSATYTVNIIDVTDL